jgi:hypothetical protein
MLMMKLEYHRYVDMATISYIILFAILGRMITFYSMLKSPLDVTKRKKHTKAKSLVILRGCSHPLQCTSNLQKRAIPQSCRSAVKHNGRTGTLAVGKYADFVALDKDLFVVSPSSIISQVNAVATFLYRIPMVYLASHWELRAIRRMSTLAPKRLISGFKAGLMSSAFGALWFLAPLF